MNHEQHIKKEVANIIKSRGLRRIHLTEAEYYRELYLVALKLLKDK